MVWEGKPFRNAIKSYIRVLGIDNPSRSFKQGFLIHLRLVQDFFQQHYLVFSSSVYFGFLSVVFFFSCFFRVLDFTDVCVYIYIYVCVFIFFLNKEVDMQSKGAGV